MTDQLSRLNPLTSWLMQMGRSSGADVTGNFAFKGKLECWKVFLQADEDCVTALADLGSTILPTAGMFYAIEKLVCQLYLPKTKISSLKDLRWLLFRRKQAESERLPPTQAALREAIKRAHYQAMIWTNDKVPNPDLPSPENYGWKKDKGYYKLTVDIVINSQVRH